MSDDTATPRIPTPEQRKEASRLATEIQRQGADPRRQVVLRASAGSGKTKVLVDRLLRLLLDGAPLKSVAAMTFTRKAAVEIRKRLTEEVVELHTPDDADVPALRDRLQRLLDRDPADHHVARARRLAEEVLEDPAGVQVGTIHTFCQSLLSRFADLAGVDPAFRILEQTDELWNEALDRLEVEIAGSATDRADYARLGSSPASARSSLDAWFGDRADLDHWCDRLTGRPDPHLVRATLLPRLAGDLARALFVGTPFADADDVADDDLRPLVLAAVDEHLDLLPGALEAEEGEPSKALVAYVAKRGDEVRDLADALRDGAPPLDVLTALRKAVFTADSHPSGLKVKCGGAGSKTTKEERNAAYAEAAVPIARACALGDQVGLLRLNRIRLGFGLRALDLYDELKRRDRCLDFHDLERRAWLLVHDHDLGPWIQYRMDARLDHLLVDEFQDTNHNQWEILEPFVQEFLAAESESGRPRTVFLVGDVKQSIYGFRGACPELFAEAAEAVADASGQNPELTLPTNFRSLAAVVDTVGERFGTDPLAGHLPSRKEVEAAAQKPYRDDAPGRVTCRPLEPRLEGSDPHEACAARLAAAIGTIVPERGSYDDVLILSRNRTHLAPYERALRDAGIPFVPAGRGALARSREVQDMLALLQWLTYPTDDVALATVLRSPLIRCDEDEIQRLLSARITPKSRIGLWRLMKTDPGFGPSTARASTLLDGWLRHVDQDTAHDLLRRIYRDADAPERFASALGEQARYNLLRLHDLALAHDAGPFPSLRGFVAAIERAAVVEDQEEGTLPEHDGGRVRMMTIHSAKGLEAPFVFLIDAAAPFREQPRSLQLGGHRGPLVSGLRKEHRHPPAGLAMTPLSATAEAAIDAQRSEEANLLYVAMTRARDELEVMGVEPAKEVEKPSYHRWLTEAGQAVEAWPSGLDAPTAIDPATLAQVTPEPTRTWTPPPSKARLKVEHPSSAAPPDDPNLPVDRTNDGMDDDDASTTAADRGTRIHLWLQRAAELGALPPGAGEEWEEARAVFENPAHDAVFRPDDDVTALCEAPVLHRLPDRETPTLMQGIVDRLLIAPDAVTVVDYKSNRVERTHVDALVAHYRPQMDAYRHALAAVYPDRPVTAALLFTHLEGDDGPGLLVTLP